MHSFSSETIKRLLGLFCFGSFVFGGLFIYLFKGTKLQLPSLKHCGHWSFDKVQKRFKGSTHDWCHQDAFEGISTYNLHDLPSLPVPKAGEREGSITMTYWSYAGLCGDLFPQFFPYLIQAVDKNLP